VIYPQLGKWLLFVGRGPILLLPAKGMQGSACLTLTTAGKKRGESRISSLTENRRLLSRRYFQAVFESYRRIIEGRMST